MKFYRVTVNGDQPLSITFGVCEECLEVINRYWKITDTRRTKKKYCGLCVLKKAVNSNADIT